MTHPEDDIARRWKVWESVVDWRQTSSNEREDVIGEIEESAREIRDHRPQAAAARLVAVNLLDALSDERVDGINSAVVADIKVLLGEIRALRATTKG